MTPALIFLLWFASLMAGIVVHEAGHALAGMSVGLQPRLITLGSGRILARVRLGRAWLVLRGVFFSGSVECLPAASNRRWAVAVMLIGGLLGNVLLVLLLAAASALWPSASSILGNVALAQVFLIVIALFPFRYGGLRSDGLWLLHLRQPLPDLRALLDGELKKLLQGSKGEARSTIPDCELPEFFYQSVQAVTSDEAWVVQDAAAALKVILARVGLPKPERALILTILLTAELTGIDASAPPAHLVAWARELGSLRGESGSELLQGMVLVMDGQFEAGQKLLHAAYAKPQGLVECAANCALLAYAATAQDDEPGARRWANEVRLTVRKSPANSFIKA